jgi:hypothetical protein
MLLVRMMMMLVRILEGKVQWRGRLMVVVVWPCVLVWRPLLLLLSRLLLHVNTGISPIPSVLTPLLSRLLLLLLELLRLLGRGHPKMVGMRLGAS